MAEDSTSLPITLPDTFTYAQARLAGLSKHEIYRRRDAGEFEVVGRGLFRRTDREVADLDLIEITTRAPLATMCLTTALARHSLTDVIPSAIDIALPRGTRAPATSVAVEWHHFDSVTFGVGRDTLRLTNSLAIGLYSAERSIVDAFRTRGREGHEIAYEALKRWLRQSGAQPSHLLRLAGRFARCSGPIREALEILL